MYDVLANYYDRFQEMDYEAFADYYQEIFQKFSLAPQLVLDLGCGTGNITLPLARRGYEMIGLDNAEQMLQIASEKAKAEGLEILFLNQDMTAFELYGTVDAMVCALDGVNYLTEDGQVEKMLSLLHYYLNPGGILIFDVNTEHKFRNVLDGQSFVYEDEDAFCVWSNEFDEAENRCYFDLTFFLQNEDGTYCRREEYQEERIYTVEELKTAIQTCNLECVGIYDSLTFQPPKGDSERIFFVVRRPA